MKAKLKLQIWIKYKMYVMAFYIIMLSPITLTFNCSKTGATCRARTTYLSEAPGYNPGL